MTSRRHLASLCFSSLAVVCVMGPAHAAKLAPLPLRMDVGPKDVRRERFHDAVSRGLAQGAPAGVTVVSAADVRAQLQGDLAACVDSACAGGAARSLGAERVVVGEVNVIGKNFTIALRLLDQSGAELGRTEDRCDICSVREADEAVGRAAGRVAAMVTLPSEARPQPRVDEQRSAGLRATEPPTEKPRVEPPRVEAPRPLPPAALPEATPSEAPRSGYRYGWIASLVVGSALVVAGVPFLAFAGRDNQITCAQGTDPKACPTVYKGNTAAGAALLTTGLVVGGVGFGTFYYLDRRERQRLSGRVALSGTAGGALLTAQGSF